MRCWELSVFHVLLQLRIMFTLCVAFTILVRVARVARWTIQISYQLEGGYKAVECCIEYNNFYTYIDTRTFLYL